MRVLNEKAMRRLLAAADHIAAIAGPLEGRIAALEAAAVPVVPIVDSGLAARVARLEKIEAAARLAGAG